MLQDITTYTDLQAVLSLATDPTLVTLNDRDGEFVVVSVTVDPSVDDVAQATELELVEYSKPEAPEIPTELRGQLFRTHLLMAHAAPATTSSGLKNVKTFKKPPNG
jgi:hypothetical protein